MSLPMFKFDAEEDLRTDHGGSSGSRSKLEASENTVNENATQGTVTTTATARSSSLARLEQLKERLSASLVQFPDFPSPGILFEDIMPLFNDYSLHTSLLEALNMLITDVAGITNVDKIVGLESRGFLIGISTALQMRCGFVPVRKAGKLPGGSAAAAGELVRKQGAEVVGYVFIVELASLKGRDKLAAPVWTLLH